MKIMVVTSCGNKKNEKPMEAYKLYKSPRIKAVYNRKGNNDMYILSAKYGLINSNVIIEPYNVLMNDKICDNLFLKIVDQIKRYDYVVFYKGGAKKSYITCIERACEAAEKALIVFGYGNMGKINDLPIILKKINKKSRAREKCY
jgi:hypothetical protein